MRGGARRGHFAEVVVGVELPSDAVDRGKRAAHKREDGRELDHAVIHHALQLRPDLVVDKG